MKINNKVRNHHDKLLKKQQQNKIKNDTKKVSNQQYNQIQHNKLLSQSIF